MLKTNFSCLPAFLINIFVLFSFFLVVEAHASDRVSDFMCPCPDNCGKALEVCECSDAPGYVKEIRAMESAGMTPQEIRDSFTAKYGQAALATPPATGFGLTAYAAPAAVLLVGVIASVWLIRRWRRPAARIEVSAADTARAEEMLKKWKS